MSTFLKLLRYGSIGLMVLVMVLGLGVASGAGWAAWQISRNPEFEGTLAYWGNTEQRGEPLGEISFSTEEGVPGGEMPEEDVRALLESGEFSGHLELVSSGGFEVLKVDLEVSAPVEDILHAVFAAMMRGTIGQSLAQQVFGDIAQMTMRELLDKPPQELAGFFGDDYEEVIMAISRGNLNTTLSEVFSHNLEQVLEALTPETLNQAVDKYLGVQADKTLTQLLAQAPEELETVLGENYESELMELFGGDPQRTLREVLVEDPSGVFDWVERVLIEHVILDELFGKQ